VLKNRGIKRCKVTKKGAMEKRLPQYAYAKMMQAIQNVK
jgi:hypothetical protein